MDSITVNVEATKILQSDPKYQRYLTWLTTNGASILTTEYPVVFGNGLIGVKAKENVPPNKVICLSGIHSHPNEAYNIRVQLQRF